MTETSLRVAIVDELQDGEVPEESETKGTKTKIITAAALGGLGVLGYFAESRGWVNGWPPPAHSLKHPWLGYYSAWAASKYKRNPNAAAVVAAPAANGAAECLQDTYNSPDHSPFHWLDFDRNSRGDGNLDNAIDLALCVGSTALFLAQNNGTIAWARAKLAALKTKYSGQESPIASPDL